MKQEVCKLTQELTELREEIKSSIDEKN